MQNYIRWGFISLCIFLSGCASIEPSLKSTVKPDPLSGYIAGSFTRRHSGGFAFSIENIKTNREYAFSLGEDTALPSDVNKQVLAIKIPPGRYQVSSWFTYGTLNKAKNGTFAITNPHLAKPFEVSANSVVYLGDFVASTVDSYDNRYSSISWSIEPIPLDFKQAVNDFHRAYPS